MKASDAFNENRPLSPYVMGAIGYMDDVQTARDRAEAKLEAIRKRAISAPVSDLRGFVLGITTHPADTSSAPEDLPKTMNRLRYSKGAAMSREPLNLLVYVIVLIVLVVLLLRVLDHV